MAMLREIAPGSPDFAAFVDALTAAKLPTEDLTAEPFRYFTADDVAWGGIGVGADALLRSIIVKQGARNCGCGARITQALAQEAKGSGVARLWLMTTDAAEFFERLGWRIMDRASAPVSIARSRQFSSLCPASAILMVREL